MLPVPELRYYRYCWRRAGELARSEALRRKEEKHPGGFALWAHTEETQQLIHFWYFIQKFAHRNYRDGWFPERPASRYVRACARSGGGGALWRQDASGRRTH